MHYGLDEEEIRENIKGLERNNRVKLSDIKTMLENEASEVEVHSRI